ncbi:helix-turn-helix domain-containing protein [Nocardia barduliensis]|uniref:helix-turn-helix domain-containing protein n=1 Tax=Nocardia barduliensis TaxID=2736643 RepID=UPI001572A5CE
MNTPQRQQSISVEQAAEAFAAEVAYWRDVKGLAKKALAARMGFDASYVSHIESGRHRPTVDFARRADEALESGTAIWKRWRDYETAKLHASKPTPTTTPALFDQYPEPISLSSTTPPASTTTAPPTGSRGAAFCATPVPSRSPASLSASVSTDTPTSLNDLVAPAWKMSLTGHLAAADVLRHRRTARFRARRHRTVGRGRLPCRRRSSSSGIGLRSRLPHRDGGRRNLARHGHR